MGCSGAQQPADQANNRYNVLFIAVDDLNTQLGCYGFDDVQTPHIDKLAASGITFKNHFVMIPTCGASRYALLTGLDAKQSGATSNAAFHQGQSALSQQERLGAQTLPELFRRSGYHTTLIGKISHSPDGKVFAYNGKGDGRPELPHAWDEYAMPYGPWERGWGAFFAYADGKHREDGDGHRDLFQFTAEKDTDLPDGLMAETTIQKLKELKHQDKPFFMGLGFFKPHLPFAAPKQDWDAVRQWDVPEPAFNQGIDTAYDNGGSGEFFRYNMPWEKTIPLALHDAMTAKRAYLACVRYVDRQIGKVLDALEKEGLADNTVVVLWGDHGYFLGEAGMFAKHTTLEQALHSPLIIRAPGITKPGTVTHSLASTLDIYPTLIDLCKPAFTKTHRPLSGTSQARVMTGETQSVRNFARAYWRDQISVRSKTHRLIAKKTKDGFNNIELYDLTKPNGLFINIADQEPGHVSGLLRAAESPH